MLIMVNHMLTKRAARSMLMCQCKDEIANSPVNFRSYRRLLFVRQSLAAQVLGGSEHSDYCASLLRVATLSYGDQAYNGCSARDVSQESILTVCTRAYIFTS